MFSQCDQRCMSSAGVVSDVVRHVVVPVVDTKLCNELYSNISGEKFAITDDMLCAGVDTGGLDACQVRTVNGLCRLDACQVSTVNGH